MLPVATPPAMPPPPRRDSQAGKRSSDRRSTKEKRGSLEGKRRPKGEERVRRKEGKRLRLTSMAVK